MKKGFTLLELIVVIIIVGILATLAINQYIYMLERQRTAEAVASISEMRKFVHSYYMENGSITTITESDLNIGSGSGEFPSSCDVLHYYRYRLARSTDTDLSVDMTRCTSGGKTPNYQGSQYIIVYTWNSTNDKTTIWCYPAGHNFCDHSGLPTSSS